MKIRNSINYNYTETPRKIYTQPSQTIPDQTMSIKTILERYARGLPVTGNNKTPIYEGEESPALNIETLDISEKQNLADIARAELKQINKKFAEHKIQNHINALKAEQEKTIKITEIEAKQTNL